MNYVDIDYIEVLLNPQQYSETEIERALEIDCKSRIAQKEMLENVENDDEIESEELDALDAACKAFEKFVFENVEKALNEEDKNEIE